MKNEKGYTVVEFQEDLKNLSQDDIDMYMEGVYNSFPGSYKDMTLRENTITGMFRVMIKERELTDKEKNLLRIGVTFAEHNRFDDLYYGGFTLAQIASAFATTPDLVMMNITFNEAKKEFENNKRFKK